MTPASVQSKPRSSAERRFDPYQLFRVSLECARDPASTIEHELRARTTNREGVCLRRISVDLTLDERHLSLVAYVACRLSARAALADLVRWLPRQVSVFNVCWEGLPCPDEYL